MNSKRKETTVAAQTTKAWKGNSAGARTTCETWTTGLPMERASLTGKRRMGGEKSRRRTVSDEVTMLVVSSRMPRTTAATRGKRIAVATVTRRVKVAGTSEKTDMRGARNMAG